MAQGESQLWEILTCDPFNCWLSGGFLVVSPQDEGSSVKPESLSPLVKIQQQRAAYTTTQLCSTSEVTRAPKGDAHAGTLRGELCCPENHNSVRKTHKSI